MSRTRKGAKGVGYEFDRRRQGKKGWTSAGPFAKRVTHRAERRIGHKEVARSASSSEGGETK